MFLEVPCQKNIGMFPKIGVGPPKFSKKKGYHYFWKHPYIEPGGEGFFTQNTRIPTTKGGFSYKPLIPAPTTKGCLTWFRLTGVNSPSLGV